MMKLEKKKIFFYLLIHLIIYMFIIYILIQHNHQYEQIIKYINIIMNIELNNSEDY